MATEKQIAYFEALAKQWEQRNGSAKFLGRKQDERATGGMIQAVRRAIEDGEISKAVISMAINTLKKELQ